MRNSLLAVLAAVFSTAVAAPTDDFVTLPFTGSFREVCKTVMAAGEPEVFDSVKDLKDKYLIADKTFLQNHPEVKHDDQPRLDEESHVVTVTAYLLSCKSERQHRVKSHGVYRMTGDNDFHIIIGDTQTAKSRMMNVEVSGLPKDGDPDGKFAAVRQQLLEVLAAAKIKPAMRYKAPPQPFKVTVTGSLYFDSTHGPGDAGDQKRGFVPKTVWEIHPIHSIIAAQ